MTMLANALRTDESGTTRDPLSKCYDDGVESRGLGGNHFRITPTRSR